MSGRGRDVSKLFIQLGHDVGPDDVPRSQIELVQEAANLGRPEEVRRRRVDAGVVCHDGDQLECEFLCDASAGRGQPSAAYRLLPYTVQYFLKCVETPALMTLFSSLPFLLPHRIIRSHPRHVR